MTPSPATASPGMRSAVMPAAQSLHECHECGRFQAIGVLRPGQVADCERCGAVLRRRRRNSLSTTFALALAGLFVMAVASTTTLVTFRLTGQVSQTSLLHLPVAFEEQGMPVLALVVLATTLVAPIVRLGLTVAVIGGLRTRLSRGALSAMARLRQILTPWAMTEVFLLGLFVAYTRLQVLATVEVGIAAVALGVLMLITIWADTWLDDDALWDAIGRHGPGIAERGTGALIGCDACGLVNRGAERDPCRRCETPLRHRKPQPVTRAWALMLTGAILYIPANVYPVLTVIRLGRGAPSTILGGVQELVEYRMWPLAILVFSASIMVPVLKLIGLMTLLIMTQRRSKAGLRERTRLYRAVDAIGRWSMIDVFMVSILTALVRMGIIGSVTPGYGAVAFALVVIFTMLAALAFDPRVMWDVAEAPAPVPKHAGHRAAAA